MKLPKEFDQAKNDMLMGGYEMRWFRPKQCSDCMHLVIVGAEKRGGCASGSYLMPLGDQTDKSCKDFEKKVG